MAIPLGPVVIAGPYTVTWNSLSLGVMVGEEGVPTIEQVNHAQVVQSSDQYGMMPICAYHLGFSYFAQFTCMEYLANVLAALNPFGNMGGHGLISVEHTTLAKALVLTAVTGLSASASPATLTATYALIAPEFNNRLLYGPKHRTFPIRMALWPYLASTTRLSYSVT